MSQYQVDYDPFLCEGGAYIVRYIFEDDGTKYKSQVIAKDADDLVMLRDLLNKHIDGIEKRGF